MRTFLKTIMASALTTASLFCAQAQAAVTQLASPAAMTTTYLNDFETVKDSGPVTFDPTSQLFLASGAASGNTPSGVQGLLSGTFPSNITANLSSYYGSVGMFFGNDDRCCSQGFSAVLSIFDNATFLGSVSVAANMNDFADQFIGLSSTVAFNRVQIDYSNAGLYNYIDDFRLGPVGAGVPEPATWAMMLFGFGFAGAALRKRKDIAPSLA